MSNKRMTGIGQFKNFAKEIDVRASLLLRVFFPALLLLRLMSGRGDVRS